MGTPTSGFDVTWRKDCGRDWFWSESTWGTIEQPDTSNLNSSITVPYRPASWWIKYVSKEHKTQEHPNREVWVNMELVVAGAPTAGSNASTQMFCNDQMRFSSTMTNSQSDSVPGGLDQDRRGSGPPASISPPPPVRKRANPHFSARKRTPDTGTLESSNGIAQTQLIVSDFETHFARGLCSHPRSRGPDFVSKEEKLYELKADLSRYVRALSRQIASHSTQLEKESTNVGTTRLGRAIQSIAVIILSTAGQPRETWREKVERGFSG